MDTAIRHNVSYEACTVCPRACGVNRAIGELGVCKAPAELHIGRAALHWWEEPCLVGEQGSGAVFFSYCPLGCVSKTRAEDDDGSIFGEVMSEFSDFEGDDNYDDEY